MTKSMERNEETERRDNEETVTAMEASDACCCKWSRLVWFRDGKRTELWTVTSSSKEGGDFGSFDEMSVIDIHFPLDEIYNKYDKYDNDKQRGQNVYGDDAFTSTPPSKMNSLRPTRFLLIISHSSITSNSPFVFVNWNDRIWCRALICLPWTPTGPAAVSRSAEIRRLKAHLLEELQAYKTVQKEGQCCGLKLYEDVFTDSELAKLTDFVNEL